MFFKKESFENSFFNDLEKNLNITSSSDKINILEKKLKALEILSSAAEDCESIGLYKTASDIITAIEDAEKDPQANLSSDEMVENFKEYGWPFKLEYSWEDESEDEDEDSEENFEIEIEE